MPDLNSVPPSPRHLFPDPAPRSGILDMPPPPLPSSSSSSNLLPSTTSRPTASRQSVEITRPGNRYTSRGVPQPLGPVATMTGQSPSREHTDRADYFNIRGTTAQGNRHGPNPVRSRGNSTSAGLGPTRHPRPMTAAELHSELEQEQEAMVNFLSRELQSLRDAHNSSVISNTSSTSTGLSVSGSEPATTTASARRPSLSHHRTSSSTSVNLPAPARPVPSMRNMASSGISSPALTRSQQSPSYSASVSNPSAASTACANPPPYNEPDQTRATPPYIQVQGRYTGPNHLPTLIGGAPPAINSPVGPYSLSRSDSMISRNSQSSSSTTTTHHQPRFPSSLSPSPAALSPALVPATSRFEETISHRLQYEAAKRENEALKQRIREVEMQLRQLNQGQRRASNGVPVEEVRVGESAASAGVQG
ncbi:hypothetical protein V8F20_002337 [Naviculisporaceae sp. PSN 640]